MKKYLIFLITVFLFPTQVLGYTPLSATTVFADANLISYYKLEDVADSKGANTLTNSTSVTFTQGVLSNAANFGAPNTSKWLGSTANYGIAAGAFWIHIWVKMLGQPDGGDMTIVNLGSGTTSNLNRQITYQRSGGVYRVFFNRSKSGVADQGPTFNTDLRSDWHMIDFTYDGTNIVGYLDGVNVTGNFAASGNGNAGPTNGFWIGDANGAGLARVCSCMVDDVAILNRVPTATEIFSLYANGAVIFRNGEVTVQNGALEIQAQ